MKPSLQKSNTSVATFTGYGKLLREIKRRIRTAQVRAALANNMGMLRLYWEVGALLVQKQKQAGWGTGALYRLAADLRNDLPDVKGFSERNLKLMTQFFREYPDFPTIGQPLVAPLESGPWTEEKGQPLVALLPWAHNIILIQKVKDRSIRSWYAGQALEHGWSRNVLALMIKNHVHERQGKSITNFSKTLLPPQSDLATQLLKDPYIFDFLTIEKPFRERELETGLLTHLQDFLVELGAGFAFVGRQVHIDVDDEDFYIDLLFYHLRLRCFIVIDLKVGPFKAEYAGKMNFYLAAVDDRLRHQGDQPSIGLILCQNKNKLVAEYALRGIEKAIGVSEYQLTRALPKKLRSALPSIEEIEIELSQGSKQTAGKAKKVQAKKKV